MIRITRRKPNIVLSFSDKRAEALFSALCADYPKSDGDADVIITDGENTADEAKRIRGEYGDGWILFVTSGDGDYADYDGRIFSLARPVSVRTVEDILADITGFVSHGEPIPAVIPTEEENVGFELDADGKTVTYGGKRITLTDREYALFALLWEHAPEPVSRDVLSKSIWDSDGENARNTNVSDVYISYLRKKIRRVFDIEAIVTLRSKGYMLIHK